MFSSEKNLIAFPVQLKRSDFNGVVYLNVKPNPDPFGKWEFTPRAVNHFAEGDNFRERVVERTLYIEHLLYTKSECLLKINEIADVNVQKDVHLVCVSE